MLVCRRIALALGGALVSGILLAVASVATALAGPTVTVRVEGESATLLSPTTVTLSAPEPVSGCPANSVAAAINLAVNGNWDHGEAIAGGDFTRTILGETHAFKNNADTWAEWVDYRWGGGICTDLLSGGDEVLMVADHEPEPSFAPTVWPLVVTGAPASVQVGTPFTVGVSEIRTPAGTFAELGQGAPVPAEGVTMSGGGTTATTGANGVATITLTSAGSVTLRATKTGDAPSTPFVVCAHNGNDGTCGTQAPSGPASTSTPVASGVAGARYTGPNAILAKAGGVIDGHVYRHGSAPRLLQGTVSVPNGLKDVMLRLTRRQRHGGGNVRCSYYDGLSERFRAMRCGAVHGRYFSLGARPSVSYLLPSTLSPGRYVFDIQAVDAAGDRSKLARGTSRIVFYVS